MNAVLFDTLKLAKRLEEAGFTTAQAQGAAAAIADTFTEDLATKRDLKELEAALRADIQSLQSRSEHSLQAVDTSLRHEIQALRTELKADIEALRTELKTDIATLRADMQSGFRDLEQRMTIRLGTMLAAAIVLVGAMVKLL